MNQSPLRVAVFIDWQNVYEGARAAFGFDYDDGHVPGNIDPWKAARLLAVAKDPTGRSRGLQQVRIYRGMPVKQRNERTHSAARAQMAAWEQSGGERVVLRTRKLKYTSSADTRGHEKGVDVQLAVDLVEIAIREKADRAIVFSSDNDVVPALELAIEERGERFIELASWRSQSAAPPLRVAGSTPERRLLSREVYDRLADPTDYGLPKGLRDKRRADWDQQIAAEGKRPRPR